MHDSSSRWIFWAAVWLAVVFVGIKAYYLGMGTFMLVGLHEFARSVAAISYADVACAAVLWVCGRLTLALAPKAVRGIAPICVVIAAAFCAAYAAASVVLSGAFNGFPTYPLLVLTRHIPMLQSAATSQLTPRVLTALGGIGVAHMLLVVITIAVVPMSASRRRVGALCVVAALIGWVAFGRFTYLDSPWQGRQDKHVARNAQWVLASSWWRVVSGQTIATMTGNFEPADLDEFQPPRVVNPSSPSGMTAASRRPPNVIVVVIESVAARWTSVNGRLYDTTPVLAAEMAAHGLVFDNFYSHIGRSSNAFVAMLMSRYPQLDNRDITAEYPRLPGTPLSSLFRASGYRTGYVTSSDLAWADWREFLHQRDFDDIRDHHDFPCSAPLSEWGVEDRCMVDQMIHFIDQQSNRPFFLIGWTTQTHYPYEPTPDVPLIDFAMEPSPDQYDLGRYLNILHETDRQLARLFAAIRAAGIDQDTLVVVTGDHGQAFGYPHPSYGQGWTAYEEDVHVPFMVWFPRFYQSGMRSTSIGSHVDLAPTVVELAGVPAAQEWQGRSLLDSSHPPRAYFYVAEDHFTLGVRENNWKYLFDLREGTDELYDLDRDPTEQRNVVAAEPARVSRLRERLAAWMEASRRQYAPLASTRRS